MYELKNSYSFFFFDLSLIFLFYVLGDTVTTWLALQLGHIEMNEYMAPILEIDYGIFIVLGFKILFFIWLLLMVIKLKEYAIMRYTTFSILCFGIFLTVSNSLVIITGYNIFQLMNLL